MRQEHLVAQLNINTISAGRRLRGLSREITLALALTAAAAASIFNTGPPAPAETASIETPNRGNPETAKAH